jgi:endonuclease YncB( thermonuclease family)
MTQNVSNQYLYSFSESYPKVTIQQSNMIKIAALFLLFLCTPFAAADWKGVVVGVADGDTATVLTTDKKQVKVRLIEIDAPEKKQAFGQQSKKSLSDICFKKPVVAVEKGKDKYRRSLVRLYCDNVDANAEQVRRGMAWAYQKYLTDRSIEELEKEARSKKVGLWSEPNPIAPWDFRHPKTPAATPARLLAIPSSETFSCEDKNAYCKSMKSCAEAMFYLKECGAAKLDRDNDGVPCEKLCGK